MHSQTKDDISSQQNFISALSCDILRDILPESAGPHIVFGRLMSQRWVSTSYEIKRRDKGERHESCILLDKCQQFAARDYERSGDAHQIYPHAECQKYICW
jgi:hypothetical protein